MNVYPILKMKASLFPYLKAFLALLIAMTLLNACETTPNPSRQNYPGNYPPPVINTPTPNKPTQETPNKDTKNTDPEENTRTPNSTPAFLDEERVKRVAIILPFSATSERLRGEANSMLRSAELALFSREDSDILLMPFDSKGTPEGARNAAQQAVNQNVDIILGPILAGSVKASGNIARKAKTPLIAFSTDTSVARDGVYLLSFPPEAEIKRVTEFVASSGARKFAFLGPNSRYGKRVLEAYVKSVENLDGIMNGVEIYQGNDITVMQEPARKLAKLYTDTQLQNEANNDPNGEAAFHVVLLPEGGTALRSLAPLLPFFEENINASTVQFMGTSLWNRGDSVREPALRGGIFAGPDLDGKKAFTANYDAVYGEEPSRLASLAYDGLNIAAFVTDGSPKTRTKRLIDPSGFFGVDGLVRFTASGKPERGLAIYQIKGGRFVIIDPAPKTSDDAF